MPFCLHICHCKGRMTWFYRDLVWPTNPEHLLTDAVWDMLQNYWLRWMRVWEDKGIVNETDQVRWEVWERGSGEEVASLSHCWAYTIMRVGNPINSSHVPFTHPYSSPWKEVILSISVSPANSHQVHLLSDALKQMTLRQSAEYLEECKHLTF